MKLYYVYSKHCVINGWFHCMAMFENGWVPFGHICSHPGYAPGDLWQRRPERQEILKKMGIEVEDTGELIDDSTIDETHPDLFAANQGCNQEYWNELYKITEGQSKAVDCAPV